MSEDRYSECVKCGDVIDGSNTTDPYTRMQAVRRHYIMEHDRDNLGDFTLPGSDSQAGP